ncbi:MAG TPA: type II toxin-antitoxin system RelE/ParE family toxin [Kaistella chaponensis]|uniref:type II toxin-antitoxin system RelE family toxin n=1 Tax=Kaistella chaponensis TaxID=713588 RepID=UPI002CD0E483|nr:type II toxin-antitoxin system RelE/ParE family toxin [Kaistella chaponensis]HPW87693.1 type II toxin-antitoxin system RelE/ParE family toxin [Kaistella chaponensis]HQC05525.1 type II toxin-antitoxin system RelE/ParE family toxin [Kaistella chaponensis]
MSYKIEFTRKALKNLSKISSKYQVLIIDKLELLSKNPFEAQNVKNLKGENDFYRLRVADYRIIFQIINKELVILVIDINHRKDIY